MRVWRNWQFCAERLLRRIQRVRKRRRGRNFAPLQGAKNFGYRKSHACGCPRKLYYAGVAELAVLRRAPPAEDTASAQKAPRSKFCTAPRCKKFRVPQESRMRLPSETILCGCGGIGRRTSLRSWRISVQVQVLSPAPPSASVHKHNFTYEGIAQLVRVPA